MHLSLDARAHAVKITSEVECMGQTGVEMEALTAVSMAALTVFDMCKASSHALVITDVHLQSKSGGQSGAYPKADVQTTNINRRPGGTPTML